MSFIASFTMLAALASAGMPAMTAQTNAPISITRCSSESTVAPVSGGDYESEETIGSQVDISFINTGSRPIHAVTFNVNDGSGLMEITDVGNFAPGAHISHIFPQDSLLGGGSTECKVASVEYPDGNGAE